MSITGNWIWSDDSDGRGYNLMSVFRRDFRLEEVPAEARLAITADSRYRLKVNGQWLGDGPARSYPSHCRYDVYNLEGMLRKGANQIEAAVRYFGCGTFHQQPQRAGFLAQLELTLPGGAKQSIVTDAEWFAARLPQWRERVAKSTIQQAPYEYYDASATDAFEWKPAVVICGAEEGPWRDLQARDCLDLTRREALLRRFVGAERVEKEGCMVAVAPSKLLFPGDTTVNLSSTAAFFLAFEAESPRVQITPVDLVNAKIAVNGKTGPEATFRAGKNFVVLAMDNLSGHVDIVAALFPASSGITAGKFRLGVPGKLTTLDSDVLQFGAAHTAARGRHEAYRQIAEDALKAGGFAAFDKLPLQCRDLAKEELFDAPHYYFLHRHPREEGEAPNVENPDALIFSDDRVTVIHPAGEDDVELCYDLGEQNIGYWNFSLFAPAGTVIDIAAIEYITPGGRLQHTGVQYGNSMRYVCREGLNRYTSFMRRGGRYLFITLRRMTGPVRFQSLRLVESTYPVVADGEFHSSDLRLDRIYEMSQRTLKLCMEDTFTDCPLFEQTLWVGDARSEALFAMSAFGAYDLARRCIRLAGESLESLPLVGCQVPSGWDAVIPVWSFMWEISLEDYYLETGDLDFIRSVWPMAVKNLENARAMLDPETGLFKAEMWNLFDWSKTDCNHPILIHNTLFLVGAVDAGVRLGVLLEEPKIEEWRLLRQQLVAALAKAWDARKLSWPDSIHADGTASKDACVHTSMLAVLFDAAPVEVLPEVRANVLSPRSELIRVGSPFAGFYLYQTLEKLGAGGEILASILRDYAPMLAGGASTVWETYANSLDWLEDDSFPTRSHCHGWSASPLYFLPRLALGLIPAEVGGRRFFVSPRVDLLEYASGARPTVHGRIEVAWRREGNRVCIETRVPPGVEAEFRANDTLADLEISFEIIRRKA